MRVFCAYSVLGSQETQTLPGACDIDVTDVDSRGQNLPKVRQSTNSRGRNEDHVWLILHHNASLHPMRRL